MEAVAVVEVAVVVPEAGIRSGTRKLQQEEALEEGGGWVASEAGEGRVALIRELHTQLMPCPRDTTCAPRVCVRARAVALLFCGGRGWRVRAWHMWCAFGGWEPME